MRSQDCYSCAPSDGQQRNSWGPRRCRANKLIRLLWDAHVVSKTLSPWFRLMSSQKPSPLPRFDSPSRPHTNGRLGVVEQEVLFRVARLFGGESIMPSLASRPPCWRKTTAAAHPAHRRQVLPVIGGMGRSGGRPDVQEPAAARLGSIQNFPQDGEGLAAGARGSDDKLQAARDWRSPHRVSSGQTGGGS